MPIFSAIGGMLGQGGASNAGSASSNAGTQAYENAITQKTSNESLEAPYLAGGWAGENALLQALGLGHLTPFDQAVGQTTYGYTQLDQSNPAADRTNALANFQASPGYQFTLDQGTKALDRSAASRGMLLSGAQGKAISDYGQNTANNEWTNYINRLAGVAGLGQGAASSTNGANTSTMNTGNSLQFQGNMGGASAFSNAANALASGIGNAGASGTSLFSNLGGMNWLSSLLGGSSGGGMPALGSITGSAGSAGGGLASDVGSFASV